MVFINSEYSCVVNIVVKLLLWIRLKYSLDEYAVTTARRLINTAESTNLSLNF